MLEKELETALISLEPAIPVPELVSPELVNRTLQRILDRHPELFWFQGKWQLEETTAGRWIIPLYSYDAAQVRQAEAMISSVIQRLILGPGTDVHRTIYENLTHWTCYGNGSSGGQTVYDAFIDRAAYCKGLSKAYQMLSAEAGIPCRLAAGHLFQKYRHVWNEIFLYGQWYCVDVSTAFPEVRATLSLTEPIFALPASRLPKIYGKKEQI